LGHPVDALIDFKTWIEYRGACCMRADYLVVSDFSETGPTSPAGREPLSKANGSKSMSMTSLFAVAHTKCSSVDSVVGLCRRSTFLRSVSRKLVKMGWKVENRGRHWLVL